MTASRQTNKQKHQTEITSQTLTIIFSKNPKQQNPPILVKINRNHKLKMYHKKLLNQYFSQSTFFFNQFFSINKLLNQNDQPRATLDRSKNYPFFQQNKNIANKHVRNQPHYSKDEEYYYQNQRFNTNNHHNNWNIDQPDPFYQSDLFELYTRNEQRQTRHHPTSNKINNFQPQNQVNTQNYQPTQMQNEILLPYYLQQHQITKTQLTNFSKLINAAESLQMTMNPYLMGGSFK